MEIKTVYAKLSIEAALWSIGSVYLCITSQMVAGGKQDGWGGRCCLKVPNYSNSPFIYFQGYVFLVCGGPHSSRSS